MNNNTIHLPGNIDKKQVDGLDNIIDIIDNSIDNKISKDEYSKQYLTIVSLVNNNTISWKASNSNLTKTISISLDDGATWTEKTSNTTGATLATLSANQKMLVKGSNTVYGNNYNYNKFISTKNFNVEGNIMSLIYGDDFIGQTTLDSAGYNFKYLFFQCTYLIDVSNLILPATTLVTYCYYGMFRGCTSLTTVTDFPATTLATYCYSYMFYGCTSLTKAPELPATTLADYCYSAMFYNCTSLTKAPKLPATILATYCYNYMFFGCTSLTKAPELPATTLDISCYSSMFSGCTSLTTGPKLPATTLTDWCYNNMFYGCTSLTKAPELPATTLTTYCYYYMFYGCTSLTKVTELPAATLADYCYGDMFYNCTSLTKAPNLPATTLANSCYYYMFSNCTSLTKVPELPAATLATYCYYYMFSGCTSLNYIKCLATDISASGCLTNWVSNVSSSGTFIKADSMTSWSTGTSGIPSEWNSYTESEYEVVRHYELTNDDQEHDYSQDYLTIVSLANNNTISWKLFASNLTKTISISLDDGATWTEKTSDTTGVILATLSANQKMLVKGSNTTYANSSYYNRFTSTGNFNIEGNIMSLINGDSFIGQTTLDSAGYNFKYLFFQCTYLIDVSNLILPAITLTTNCYNSMFNGCTSLTTAPELPATILADKCYSYMFYGCTSLIEAPELPATTLASSCYYYMFSGCTSLNYIKCLATNISASSCLLSWVSSVSSVGVFVKDKSTNFSSGDSGIPTNWVKVNYIPNIEEVEENNEHDYSQDYLTFVSLVDNNTISWKASNSNLTKTISISLDDGATWTSVTSTTSGATLATLNANQKMLVKGSNTVYSNGNNYNQFISTKNFNVEGNIMSLIYADNFIGQTTLDLAGYNFTYLFYYCTYLKDASNLILPATTLTVYCYHQMFSDCTSLTKAPELPATTLNESCYMGMFSNCTSLTKAPELSATTLINKCYYSMFYQCSNLNYIKCLATNISASDCLTIWAVGVSRTGTFYKSKIMTSLTTGPSGIPTGWKIYNARIMDYKIDKKYYQYVDFVDRYQSGNNYLIMPNVEYFFLPSNSNKTFDLSAPIEGIKNEYIINFKITGDTNPTITFPSNIEWKSTPAFNAGYYYAISIKYDNVSEVYYGLCISFYNVFISDLFTKVSSSSILGSYGTPIIIYNGTITDSNNNTITNPIFCNANSSSKIQIACFGGSYGYYYLQYYDLKSKSLKTKSYTNSSQLSVATSAIIGAIRSALNLSTSAYSSNYGVYGNTSTTPSYYIDGINN